jgi:hypothetical protein
MIEGLGFPEGLALSWTYAVFSLDRPPFGWNIPLLCWMISLGDRAFHSSWIPSVVTILRTINSVIGRLQVQLDRKVLFVYSLTMKVSFIQKAISEKSYYLRQRWMRLIWMFQPAYLLLSTMARGSYGSGKKSNCLCWEPPASSSTLNLT